MLLKELSYDFPEELIALQPSRPTRVMYVNDQSQPQELTLEATLQLFQPNDVLVINDTRVLKRRVFVQDLEILFLDSYIENNKFLAKVLFPSKKYKVGDQIQLPQNVTMTLVEKGLPQIVELSRLISEEEFETWGELPLPPYIQKARQERHNLAPDETWYQTAWANKPGSFAAPTASLHFSQQDLFNLKSRGVHVETLTLHVGLGTFLPVKVENLNDHKMHGEVYQVPESTWLKIQMAKQHGHRVWALGTTVSRTLETVARTGQLTGVSELLLQVGSEFKIVDCLMTNFHQPESTLLALVAGFAGLESVQKNYQWAIERKFKLFSYGDFSVWDKRDLR